MGYSLIEGRFHYPDGDHFNFEGFLDDYQGGGSFVAGETIKPGDKKGWEYSFDSSRYSYVTITKAENFAGSIYDHPSYNWENLVVTSYYDSNSLKTVIPTEEDYNYASDFDDFSGELFVEGMIYKFDSGESVNLPGAPAPAPAPAPEPAPAPAPTPAPAPAPAPEPAPAPAPAPAPEPAPAPMPTNETPTGTAPNLLRATLRGDQITLQFDDAISDTLPRVSNFTLKNGSREVGFKDAEVIASAGQAILTANKEIDSTANITLDYFDLASDQVNGVIQSQTGVDLASFTGFQLNNQTEQVNTLAFDDGDFEGNIITLNLNAPLSSSTPSTKRFNVNAGRKKQRIIDVSSDAAEGLVTLTTQKPIGSYESIKVSYKDLGGDQTQGVIEDKAGNDMVTVRDFEIINGGYEEIPPKLLAAELDDNILTLEFDSIINNTKLSKNRFKVKANGKKLRVKSASVEDDDESFVSLLVQPKRNKSIDLQSEVTLSYSDPKGDQGKNVVEDLFGNDLASINNFFVDIV